MRFMMLVIPKGYEKAKPGTMPDPEMVKQMMVYNESLEKAGVLLELNGLHPVSTGARVTFEKGKTRVEIGSFSDLKETLGGYWIIQVKSRDEAIEWASKAPMADGDIIEIRQVQEMSEFPPEIQAIERQFAGKGAS